MYVDSYLAMAEQEADTAKMDAKVDTTVTTTIDGGDIDFDGGDINEGGTLDSDLMVSMRADLRANLPSPRGAASKRTKRRERQSIVDARLEPNADLSIIMDCADAQENHAPPYTIPWPDHAAGAELHFPGEQPQSLAVGQSHVEIDDNHRLHALRSKSHLREEQLQLRIRSMSHLRGEELQLLAVGQSHVVFDGNHRLHVLQSMSPSL
jgi:hypothetical protein